MQGSMELEEILALVSKPISIKVTVIKQQIHIIFEDDTITSLNEVEPKIESMMNVASEYLM